MRQRLVTQERKDYVRSPAEVSRGRSPVLEPLRNLITNLGPPPLAVTWNRPQISSNTPPSYSRFQNFMLRNAFRSTESFVTARAVYDGGESKVSYIQSPQSSSAPVRVPRGMRLMKLARTRSRLYASSCGTLMPRASTMTLFCTVI